MSASHRLIVIFGGASAEHDVSCVTARHVMAAASADRYDLEAIGITRDGEWVRTDAAAAVAHGIEALPDTLVPIGESVAPAAAVAPHAADDRPIVVLPLLHGPMGEDGTVQGLLDLADVAYIGSGVLGSALCMDKAMAKRVAADEGISQADWLTLHADEIGPSTPSKVRTRLGSMVFVKPANMGSSVGVSRASTEAELIDALNTSAAYDEWIIVEEAVTAREIEVGVLGNRPHEASVPGEIVPGDDFYSYDDKYHDGVAQTLIPADLTSAQAEEVRSLARRAAGAMRVEGLARVDFFLEEPGRGFLLNEINTMPGFTPISMFPKLWQASGIGYPELIDRLVELAIERHARRHAHRSIKHS